MTRLRISATAILVCLAVDGRNLYSNDAVRQAFPEPSAARGVVVVAGAGDGKPIVELAKAAPVVVLAIARIFAIDAKRKRFVSVGGGIGTASGRGGGGDSKVHLMKMLGTPVSERRGKRFVEQAWEYDDRLLSSRGLPSVSSLAVSDNAVYLGMSIYGTDRQWREASAEMPHRLRILDLERRASSFATSPSQAVSYKAASHWPMAGFTSPQRTGMSQHSLRNDNREPLIVQRSLVR